MIVSCPECGTRYTLPDAAFEAGPRKVRCKECEHVWMQEKPADEPPEEDLDTPVDEPVSESEVDEDNPAAAEQTAPRVEDPRPARAAVAEAGFPIEDFGGGSRGLSADRILTGVICVIVLIGLIAAAVQFRTELSRTWPTLAGFYSALGVPVNASGMEIHDSSWEIETRDGLPLLTVRGEVLNTSGVDKAVPRLRFSVRDKAGRELYFWAMVPEVKRLGPGARHRFSTQLPSPPLDAHDIEIRFDIDGS